MKPNRSHSSAAAEAFRSCLAVVLLFSCVQSGLAQSKYQSAEEAYRVGAAFYNSRNFAAAREPFEAALAMAPDDAFRVKVYEALLAPYRMISESEKFIEAAEFIISKSDSAPKRSLTRRALLVFVNQRGLVDPFIKRHEAVLDKQPENRTSLYLLSELYASVKRDPQKAAALTERLAKIDQKEGQPVDVLQSANLARQYVQSKKFKEGAELYEKIAPLDEKLAAWHLKEAAAAWLKAGDKKKALAAAKKSAESAEEARSELLAHFWHRGLADVFLQTGEAKLAIPHYEKAIEKSNIQGYIDDCRKSLEEARTKAGKQ